MLKRAVSLQLPLGEITDLGGHQLAPWSFSEIPHLGAPGGYFIPAPTGIGGYDNFFAANPPGAGEVYSIYSFVVGFGILVAVTGWVANSPITITMALRVDNQQVYAQQQSVIPVENPSNTHFAVNSVFGSADLFNPIEIDRHQVLSMLFTFGSQTQDQPNSAEFIVGAQIGDTSILPFLSTLNYYINHK